MPLAYRVPILVCYCAGEGGWGMGGNPPTRAIVAFPLGDKGGPGEYMVKAELFIVNKRLAASIFTTHSQSMSRS